MIVVRDGLCVIICIFPSIRAALLKEASPPGPVDAIPTSTKMDVKSDVSHAKSTLTAAKSKGKRKREGLLGVVKKKPAIEDTVKDSGKDRDNKDAETK